MPASDRGGELLAWLASVPAPERDAALEARLCIPAGPCAGPPPGEHLVGYHASGVACIVRMLLEVPVMRDDVFVDLGAGLGKVVLLTHLLTGAAARGIEVQPALVRAAREAAARSGVPGVAFDEGDVLRADLDDGTVFFLYSPFTGPVLDAALRRLNAVAERHAIVVAALGVDLERLAPWLARRPLDSFWLAIYDSRVPGVPPRPPRARSPLLAPAAEIVALARAGG